MIHHFINRGTAMTSGKFRYAAVFILAAGVLYTGTLTGLRSEDAIALPAPDMNGGRPLMQVLKNRQSIRSFSEKALSRQTLSNLLWAACGVNRAKDGKRTAPSAMNRQEIDVYVAMADGMYLYNAKNHSLGLVVRKDLREMTGKQPFVKGAPVNLVYVADLARMQGSDDDKSFYAGTDTGFIAQNVYLFCASEGLGTVVRGYVDRERLAKEMGLRANQKITLAQTVGYAK